MKLPENCSFAVAPTDEFGLPEFGLLLNEPSNCCRSSLVGTEEPLCRSRATEDEAYRFIWHSSFDGHAMVHIGCKGDAIALRWNYPRFLRRIDSLQECGSGVLSAADRGRLHRTLDAAKFWSLDASGNRSGLDGANWLIERTAQGHLSCRAPLESMRKNSRSWAAVLCNGRVTTRRRRIILRVQLRPIIE
jgi:hypothetical protein